MLVSEEILRQQELEARVAAAERDDVLDSEWVYPQSQGDEDTAEDETEDEVKEQEITNIEYVEVLMVDPEMAYAQGTTLRVFDYTLGWTEGMVFLLSFCLGGTLVGLAQTRTLIRQMSEEMGGTGSASQRRHVSLLVGGIISMTAMSLTAWVIMEELWTSPPEYFAGFGIAGVILVQVWIPDAPLQVALDSIDTKRYNFGDEEKVVGTLERRNACSLDVNSRAELATTNSKGQFTGYDQACNIILTQTHERIYSSDEPMKSVPIGVYVIRGEIIAVIGDLDPELDEATDFENMRVEPLEPVRL
ncbi:hypothetical protein BGZ59_005217 [Podila verticillata]|nr:hypothetical protein BGZ59_005217 [Podila verticillata]